jgi:hypothetical protein
MTANTMNQSTKQMPSKGPVTIKALVAEPVGAQPTRHHENQVREKPPTRRRHEMSRKVAIARTQLTRAHHPLVRGRAKHTKGQRQTAAEHHPILVVVVVVIVVPIGQRCGLHAARGRRGPRKRTRRGHEHDHDRAGPNPSHRERIKGGRLRQNLAPVAPDVACRLPPW